MSVYVDDIATVIELLEEFGQVVSVDMLKPGVSASDTPWIVETPPPPTDPDEPPIAPPFSAQAVFVGTSGLSKSQEVSYSAKVYARPLDAANLITNNCRFTDAAGEVWKVINADLLAPDGVSRIVYTCEVIKWPSL
jgi:hypothetical protein